VTEAELLDEVDRRIEFALVELGAIVDKRLVALDALLADLEKKLTEMRALAPREPVNLPTIN
jgi:hypothetical protein